MLKLSANEPFRFWISREPQKNWRHLEHSRACNMIVRKYHLTHIFGELNREFKLNMLKLTWRMRRVPVWGLWSPWLTMHLLSLWFTFYVCIKHLNFYMTLMLCSIIWSCGKTLCWWRLLLKELWSMLISYNVEQRKKNYFLMLWEDNEHTQTSLENNVQCFSFGQLKILENI